MRLLIFVVFGLAFFILLLLVINIIQSVYCMCLLRKQWAWLKFSTNIYVKDKYLIIEEFGGCYI